MKKRRVIVFIIGLVITIYSGAIFLVNVFKNHNIDIPWLIGTTVGAIIMLSAITFDEEKYSKEEVVEKPSDKELEEDFESEKSGMFFLGLIGLSPILFFIIASIRRVIIDGGFKYDFILGLFEVKYHFVVSCTSFLPIIILGIVLIVISEVSAQRIITRENKVKKYRKQQEVELPKKKKKK